MPLTHHHPQGWSSGKHNAMLVLPFGHGAALQPGCRTPVLRAAHLPALPGLAGFGMSHLCLFTGTSAPQGHVPCQDMTVQSQANPVPLRDSVGLEGDFRGEKS